MLVADSPPDVLEAWADWDGNWIAPSEVDDGLGNGCTLRAAVVEPTFELAAVANLSVDGVDVAPLPWEGAAPVAVSPEEAPTEAICPGEMDGIAVDNALLYESPVESCPGASNTEEVGVGATVLKLGSLDPGPLPMAGTEPFCFPEAPEAVLVARVVVMTVEGMLGSVTSLLADTTSEEELLRTAAF